MFSHLKTGAGSADLSRRWQPVVLSTSTDSGLGSIHVIDKEVLFGKQVSRRRRGQLRVDEIAKGSNGSCGHQFRLSR